VWTGTCIPNGMPDRRPVHRHLCSELVSLSCTGKGGQPLSLSGNLEEIGEWSAVVLTESPLPRRTRVRVTCETHQLKGLVRSCTSVAALYSVFQTQAALQVEILALSGLLRAVGHRAAHYLLPDRGAHHQTLVHVKHRVDTRIKG